MSRKLIEGDDGLPADDVGPWAKEKHSVLCSYVEISKATRRKYLPPNGRGGASYIDLFCATGRPKIRDTNEWIDGSPVAAWKKSRDGGAPFSKVIIGDADQVCLDAATKRLQAAGAPVVALHGDARQTAFLALQKAPSAYGLNFAFLDPYNLESLDFEIFRQLARMKRVDILVHVSTMDMTRNLKKHLTDADSAFDAFAPGWREALQIGRPGVRTREDLLEYWRNLVAATGKDTSDDVKLIRGEQGQRLYWLLLAASSQLAHKFRAAILKDKQGSLF